MVRIHLLQLRLFFSFTITSILGSHPRHPPAPSHPLFFFIFTTSVLGSHTSSQPHPYIPLQFPFFEFQLHSITSILRQHPAPPSPQPDPSLLFLLIFQFQNSFNFGSLLPPPLPPNKPRDSPKKCFLKLTPVGKVKLFFEGVGFCPPCQKWQWVFVLWAFVQWVFVLVGFCPSGFLSVPHYLQSCVKLTWSNY